MKIVRAFLLPPKRKPRESPPIAAPVPRPFDFGFTERRPLVPLPAVMMFLDRSANEVIEQLAKKEGQAEGREEGRKEGARAELLTAIRALLKDKFGASGTRLMEKVKSVEDLARLRDLLRAVAKADSLQEIRDQIHS